MIYRMNEITCFVVVHLSFQDLKTMADLMVDMWNISQLFMEDLKTAVNQNNQTLLLLS